jgi:hypothetical protein
MTIAYTLPSINVPHGGYRIVLEHLHRLKARGHNVFLFIESDIKTCDWYPNQVKITRSQIDLKNADVVVLGSPHSVWYTPRKGQKVFCFVQMEESKFRPHDGKWINQCLQFYKTPYPKLYGSEWIGEYLEGEKFYIPDGINTNHFPVEDIEKPETVLLVEGWECSNPAKDTEAIAPKVCEKLKERYRVKVLAYGFQPLKRYSHVPDEYYYRPSVGKMNDLYRRASILIKATKFDSRALSPIEAATKKCVTVRAIIRGDDYLMNQINCLRNGYDEEKLYLNTEFLIKNREVQRILIDRFDIPDWNPIIDKLENIYDNYPGN